MNGFLCYLKLVSKDFLKVNEGSWCILEISKKVQGVLLLNPISIVIVLFVGIAVINNVKSKLEIKGGVVSEAVCSLSRTLSKVKR